MRLEHVSIAGFRCFGTQPVRISLGERITMLVGPNAAGKTALLNALGRLFGASRAQRMVVRSDFHLPAGADPEDRSTRHLFVDVLVGLPELVAGTATAETIAPSFRHMRIERAGEAPVCRLRLEAQWQDDGTAEGEVSQELFWIDTLDDEPTEEQRHPVEPGDRGLVHLYYMPASRDASAQIRATTGALAARLLRAIEWSKQTRETVEEVSEKLEEVFEAESAIQAITEALEDRWSDLHDEVVDTKPKLTLMGRRIEEVVSRINVMFERGPDGLDRGLDAFSDGQQSLFYFALAAAVFDLERQVVDGEVDGFRSEELRIPALTIFGLEEPENHLSPYYLARIIRQVDSLTEEGAAQAIITSHSPAVLSRVKPADVRYCRCDPKRRTSSVKAIDLPTDAEEAVKFVRQALMSFPELYFARFVVLVEGDSERIVLPMMAKAMDLLVDPAFVAVVPLGGRHVQHFWRLLRHLEIPYATLLDLDLGREGGGFGRIKTALQQLLDVGVERKALLELQGGKVLAEKELQAMRTWTEWKLLPAWLAVLQRHGVFFSTPLDLDLAMLAAFPNAYQALIPEGGGPRTTPEKAAEAVLGTGGPGLDAYGGDYVAFRGHLPAYRYHFLTHSKPATHLLAMTHLSRKRAREGMPEVLRALLEHVQANLRRE